MKKQPANSNQMVVGFLHKKTDAFEREREKDQWVKDIDFVVG